MVIAVLHAISHGQLHIWKEGCGILQQAFSDVSVTHHGDLAVVRAFLAAGDERVNHPCESTISLRYESSHRWSEHSLRLFDLRANEEDER